MRGFYLLPKMSEMQLLAFRQAMRTEGSGLSAVLKTAIMAGYAAALEEVLADDRKTHY